MIILGMEKLSLVDYPNNVCAVLFTSGCNFRCPFCHNSGIVMEDFKPLNNIEIFDFLKERRKFLDGVCVSGGEPTLQPDLVDFIRKIKELGFKVKLDTNGTNPKVLEELLALKLIDYVAMDIKNSFEKYPLTTATENVIIKDIKESIEILKKNNIDYEFRTTLIKEFHTEEEIHKISEILKGAKRLYLQRYISSDNCINNNLTAVEKDIASSWKDILSKNIQEVFLRGYV